MIARSMSCFQRTDGKQGKNVLHWIHFHTKFIKLTTHSGRLRSYLEQGIHVVCDRYAFSGVAFSASKVRGESVFATPRL
jgi:hypothetical protein